MVLSDLLYPIKLVTALFLSVVLLTRRQFDLRTDGEIVTGANWLFSIALTSSSAKANELWGHVDM